MEEVKGLTERRNTIYALLEKGRYSASELTILTGFCDPRSYIRYLRKKGIKILDEWNTSAKGSRYKVYYIPQPQAVQK